MGYTSTISRTPSVKHQPELDRGHRGVFGELSECGRTPSDLSPASPPRLRAPHIAAQMTELSQPLRVCGLLLPSLFLDQDHEPNELAVLDEQSPDDCADLCSGRPRGAGLDHDRRSVIGSSNQATVGRGPDRRAHITPTSARRAHQPLGSNEPRATHPSLSPHERPFCYRYRHGGRHAPPTPHRL
jgi:hypothetical protein